MAAAAKARISRACFMLLSKMCPSARLIPRNRISRSTPGRTGFFWPRWKPNVQISLGQKIQHKLGCGLRILFHDPMAGFRYHAALDIAGDIVQFRFHLQAVGFFAAQRQDRDRKLALGAKGPVVHAILRESLELLECVMHGVRSGIEAGVMNTRSYIDAFGMRRKLVIETIEIDALAPGHQPLLVGTIEI